jgi:hypothetical protein
LCNGHDIKLESIFHTERNQYASDSSVTALRVIIAISYLPHRPVSKIKLYKFQSCKFPEGKYKNSEHNNLY